jgi:endoglucanase
MHDPITGLNHEVGHLKDQAAIMFFSDEFHEKGERLDQTGGWYDASDYGKYTSTAAISVANILLAYELHPESFPKGQMMFPEDISVAEQKTALPDVLIEMKYELDWMMKMQRPDGAVYHKVAGKFWPELTTLPEQDTQNRYIYGLSTFVTGQYAGALATASRAYQKYDAAYAEQLLAKARQAFDFLETHPSPIFRNDQGQNAGSGPYDKLTDSEERFWAAAELFKTTGDKKYEDYIKNNLSSFITKEPGFISWNNTLALGHWAYLTSHSADKILQQQVQTAFLGYADKVIKQISQDGYKCSLKNDQYTWSSAKNTVANANILIMAYQLDHKAAYLDGALDQIHYILGRNTNSQSYLTGSGVKQVQHPHLRMKESTGIYIPGLLVGGPNNHPGGDTLQSKLLEDNKAIPPAKAYIDQVSSYSTNEHAIDLTAPVVYALAYFTYNTGK